MVAFQEVITSIFDALRAGPKRRYRPAIENVNESTLDFALATPGSVVLSLSIPNERLLIIQSDMDRTVALAFALLGASSSDDIRNFVKIVGVATISKVYNWAETHADYDLRAQIKWNKDWGTAAECTVSEEMARNLKTLIAEASDEEYIEVTLDGVLLGIDGSSSYFHLAVPDAEEIKGKLHDKFPKLADWTINRRHRAELIKTVRLRYATGEETVIWTLRSLFDQNKSA